MVKEKPSKTKKFLVKKKHPDSKSKAVKMKQKPENTGPEDGKEFVRSQSFSELTPEEMQKIEMISNGERTEHDDGDYIYYTDSEAAEVRTIKLFHSFYIIILRILHQYRLVFNSFSVIIAALQKATVHEFACIKKDSLW